MTKILKYFFSNLALTIFLFFSQNALARTQTNDETKYDVHRDVQNYAIASCLTLINEQSLPKAQYSALKKEGYLWAGAIFQNSPGDYEFFIEMLPSIKNAVANNPMAEMKGDTSNDTGSTPTPIFYCVEKIAGSKSVKKAMKIAVNNLKKDYRKAMLKIH